MGIPRIYNKSFDDRNVIFIHIPKTAGSSIGKEVFGTEYIGHYPYYLYKYYDCEKYKNYYKFCVSRDPISRFISAYNYLLSGGKGLSDIKCREWIKSKSSDINDFIVNTLNESNIYSWVHFVPQTYFIFNLDDKCQVDKVIKLENLDAELNHIKALGLTGVTIQRENVTRNKIETNLTNEALEKLNKLYERDFRLLGYMHK